MQIDRKEVFIMGSDYTFYKDEKFGELSICEHSNTFDLCLYNENLNIIPSSEEISPENMARIFLKGLKVCSYWMDEDQLKGIIQQFIKEI
jgi:hypothetical protein